MTKPSRVRTVHVGETKVLTISVDMEASGIRITLC